jgi:hypothetical protein
MVMCLLFVDAALIGVPTSESEHRCAPRLHLFANELDFVVLSYYEPAFVC